MEAVPESALPRAAVESAIHSQSPGPALPWGTSSTPATAQTAPQPTVQPDVPSSMSLGVGAALEVKWEIADDEAGVTTVTWWQATIAERVEGRTDGEGRQVYVLRYAANPEAGFDEEALNQVTFLNEHHLYDLGEDEELPWRRQGEEWEDEAEEGPAAGGQGEAREQVFTVAEVDEQIRQRERRRGRSVEEECEELLRQLPSQQQRVVAAGFREFTDMITEGIAKLYQKHGPDYVVTASDIESLRAQVASRLAQGTFRGY